MKKVSLALSSVSTTAGFLTLLATNTFAATVENITVGNVQNQGIRADETLGNILKNGFTILIVVAVLAVLGFVIYGAFLWITSGGEKEKTGKARKVITDALVGLAVLALAFFIVRFVGQVVGINVLGNFAIPTLGNTASGS
jgi:small-conductance mechanosensitive channel